MATKQPRWLKLSSLLLVLFSALTLFIPVAVAAEPANTQGFRKAVTLSGIREHQSNFQVIANANGGNRLAGTSGFDASAAYVFNKLEAAGYNPVYQEFEFLLNSDRTPSVLQRISPLPKIYVDGSDFSSMTYSGNGDITAQVFAVDLSVSVPPPGGSSTSGCEAADIAGFTPGSIALMLRGTCTFRIKAENAAAAGASGVIIYNDGATPDRIGNPNGTLNPPTAALPTVSTSFSVGDELRNGLLNGNTGTIVRLKVDRINETRTTRNVIAETASGDPNNVIVVGAHLDSVARGPGINDNGSGSATILEVAETLAAQGRDVRNKLRFIWFSAEEEGLLGSRYYVSQLSTADRAKIRLNLNFDMIGSPNFVRFIYDGDNSAFPVGPGAAAGPAGSGEIERVFRDYFDSQGLPTEPTPFSGRSDYGPFIEVGIPAGGLFTGAEGIKTTAQVATYGGTAGQQYDPCYHLACDTFANNSDTALDQMSDAVAHTVLYFSKRNFDKEPLVNPGSAPGAGAVSASGSGGWQDDHKFVDQ